MSGDGPKTEEEIREGYEYQNFRYDDDNKFAGSGIFESFYELVSAAKKDGEKDAAQIAVAGVTVGLDVLGMVLDPLGTVFAAGVGWLIEHIGFLREPLDLLMGDPDAVKANAALLQLEAKKFEDYAKQHDDALAAVKGWQGEAADRFRKSMHDLSEEIRSYGEVISGASDTTVNMGVGVAAVRAVVRDIIAMLVGSLVAGALVAVAAAPFTFGASIAGFVATMIGMAAATAAKIAKVISKVTTLVARGSKRMGDLAKYMADLSKRLERFAQAAKRNPYKSGSGWKNPSDDLAKVPPFKSPPKSDAPPSPPPRADTAPPGTSSQGAPPPKMEEPPPPKRQDSAPPGTSSQGAPPPKMEEPPPPKRQDSAPPGGNVPPPKMETPPSPPPRSNSLPADGNPPPPKRQDSAPPGTSSQGAPPPKMEEPPPPKRQDSAPPGGNVPPPPKTETPPSTGPQRADTMPNMPPPKGVPESSWNAWTKGGYRNQDQLMRPINELNRLPRDKVAEIARKLFGAKGGNDVMHALDTAKNVREPQYMINLAGVQVPVGAFGATFSQMANEATKADDGREDAREAAGR
jgi:uncharacterized protein YukE